MDTVYLAFMIISIALLMYLTYVILYPERF